MVEILNKEESKREDTMGKSVLALVFLMALCCGLPIILVAVGLGAVGALIQSNIPFILAGVVIIIGVGYAIWRRRCGTCNVKPKAK